MSVTARIRKILIAALLSCFALNAYAVTAFVGGDLGLVLYPNLVQNWADQLFAQPNTLSVTSTQALSSAGIDFRGGAWFTKNIGVEGGFGTLGSVSGTVDATYFVGMPSYETFKYTASEAHVAGLFGIEQIHARVGLHSTTTKLDWTGSGAFCCSYTRSVSSTGLLLGVGSNIPIGEHVALMMALNIFNGVKFVDAATLNTDVTKTLYRLSFGAAYKF